MSEKQPQYAMPEAAGTAEAGLEELDPDPVPVEGMGGVLVGTSPLGERVQRESLPPAPQNWVLSPLQIKLQLP